VRPLQVLALGLFFLLAACGPQQQDAPVPVTQSCTAAPEIATAGLALVVGKGGTGTFVPLVAHDRLPLQHGSQGGTHVYIDLLFHADVAGAWKITSHLARPDGRQESDASVMTACAGWNRIDNLRFVLYGGGGEGDLDVRAVPIDGSAPELKTAPVAVTIE
jgi:hypothetical protein